MIAPFSIARLPRIEFGAGRLAKVPELAARYGTRALIVTGGQSLRQTEHWESLTGALSERGMTWKDFPVNDEPSPKLVDHAVRGFLDEHIDVVLGIGGGSVLDAAKAIAGLLPRGGSVMDHLEGVGPEKPYEGPSLPYIAVPTTAGTGSEATKNAVLSERGAHGFKKSFRDEQLVPQYAVVDPELLTSCPPDLIAANGMDALTQLLESYVSLKANPFTDALALSGLAAVRDGLLAWYETGPEAAAARGQMAYAALISGITLAQCGLGSVHGLASPLGAFSTIPHGVACGTMVATCTDLNIRAMREREPNHPALGKYAAVGALFTGKHYEHREEAWVALLEILSDWTYRMKLPTLSEYGIGETDMGRIVANSRGSSMKTNPIVLTDAEIAETLRARL